VWRQTSETRNRVQDHCCCIKNTSVSSTSERINLQASSERRRFPPPGQRRRHSTGKTEQLSEGGNSLAPSLLIPASICLWRPWQFFFFPATPRKAFHISARVFRPRDFTSALSLSALRSPNHDREIGKAPAKHARSRD
jgi:hypothetical protein